MGIAVPNRTAELAGYTAPDTLTLSGTALAGYRTFAAAVTASKLADGDRVGLAIQSTTNPGRWAVWQATYTASGGTLTRIDDAEDAGAALIDGEQVQVAACWTDALLAERIDGPPAPSYYDGPTYWDEVSDPLTWNASEEYYEHGGSFSFRYLDATGSWATGLRPTTLTCEVWIPSAAGSAGEYVEVYVYAGAGEFYAQAGSGYQLDAWNTIVVNLSLAADIDQVALRLSGAPISGYRLRHMLFE